MLSIDFQLTIYTEKTPDGKYKGSYSTGDSDALDVACTASTPSS